MISQKVMAEIDSNGEAVLINGVPGKSIVVIAMVLHVGKTDISEPLMTLQFNELTYSPDIEVFELCGAQPVNTDHSLTFPFHPYGWFVLKPGFHFHVNLGKPGSTINGVVTYVLR